jgi:hypothetical protein
MGQTEAHFVRFPVPPSPSKLLIFALEGMQPVLESLLYTSWYVLSEKSPSKAVDYHSTILSDDIQ